MGDGTQPRPVGLSTGPFVGRQADLLAAAEILGAGAGVLVLGDRGVGRTRLLAELASRHAGLTCVYDVDLLDDGAADALALAVRGGGRVALTARSVDGLGGSLRSLVRSGALLSVRLRPLGLAETRVIVAHGLLVATAGAGGGPDGAAAGRAGSPDGASHVADRLVEHLFRHTAGNPGMVHDVLAAMLQGGRIERRGGVHTLAGLAVTSPRARAEQVRGDEHDPTTQPPQVREVLEILAI